ncbi:histone deacetylase family protein [Rubricoccus marinus]|uniref:Histone deacetylase domain-containing protein n=1 Tax=Rubricoccus marinus TaxID=716817 RepID=A0A259TZ70_9BACT|nr:histone deacetylase [Rubricoccus marinus]OZC03075.1 hypothetical protein BSZ36_08885 [Rubricoccus marinus]
MTLYSLRDDHALHSARGHPERPARLEAVRERIEANRALVDLVRVQGAPASREDLERVHDPAYLDALEAFCENGGGMLDVDTYATRESLRLVRGASGDVIEIVRRVCAGEADNGFALGRPPGHHARPAQAMGFCLLSNAAIAARFAQEALGAGRVMIVDTDVHHGNGTQEAFYDDPSVLFVSSQQADIFPGTGAMDETGTGAGEGSTVNLAVPGGTTDAGLVGLYRETIGPLAARFRPDLILLSAGYDAHRLDPIGGLSLSVSGLTDLVRVVMEAADAYASGRLVLTLEGGYHPEVLGAGVASSLRALLDPTAEPADPFGPSRREGPDLTEITAHVRALHGL